MDIQAIGKMHIHAIGKGAAFRGVMGAVIITALGGTCVAFVASVLGYLDAHVVALIALISATVACLAAFAYFLYLIVSDRTR